jgi:hypothetical protein
MDENQYRREQVAKALDAPPFDESKQNYEALGRFITSYAHAEASLHELSRKPTGLSDEKARVLFAGMRLSVLHAITRSPVTLRVRQHAGTPQPP